jgi:protein-arginine kinase activator protein McsA
MGVDTVLCSVAAETEINPWVSMAHKGSLQHVSKCLSLHMNIKHIKRKIPKKSKKIPLLIN